MKRQLPLVLLLLCLPLLFAVALLLLLLTESRVGGGGVVAVVVVAAGCAYFCAARLSHYSTSERASISTTTTAAETAHKKNWLPNTKRANFSHCFSVCVSLAAASSGDFLQLSTAPLLSCHTFRPAATFACARKYMMSRPQVLMDKGKH